MALTRADFKYRYRRTLNNQLQPVTDWLDFTEENSTISGYNFSLNVGDINIQANHLEIQTPQGWPFYGRILYNDAPYTTAVPDEPEPVNNTFSYTFPFILA